MRQIKYKYILYILLFFLFVVIAFGAKRTNFIETGNISNEAITNKQKYLLKDYRGLNYARIKSRVYNTIKPQVVTIGSSRVLQFRETFFNKDFYNMGYTVGSIPEIKAVTDLMDKNHNPELIIVGIDFWWFLKKYTSDPIYTENAEGNKNIRNIFKNVFKPYLLLLRNKNTLAGLIESFDSPDITRNSSGTIHDGSFVYIDAISGFSFNDAKFKGTEKRVHECTSPFFIAREVSKKHVETFVAYAKNIQNIAKNVIFIMPPISNYIYNDLELNKTFYPHIFSLKKRLEDEGLHVFDYTNPSLINSSDCEMLDGFHGGDITYARLLLDLSQKNPSIQHLVNTDYLSDSIRNFNGYAMIPDHSYFDGQEVDFLELNCKK